VAAAELAGHAAALPLLAVLFSGDPARTPESWDVGVVLPELLRTVPGLRAATLSPADSQALASAYGVVKFPSLVVLGHGEYAGVIEGMRDWLPFCAELAQLVAAARRRTPAGGIPVVQDSSARPA
jgi:hydrogenase-1 operon protein HyaE